MLSRFRDFVQSYQNELFLVGVVILVAFVSFGLGRLSVGSGGEYGELVIESTPIEINKLVEALDQETRALGQGASEPTSIVGNKNSKIYHRSDCSGAQRMNESNKVYFASITAARNAGYRAAGNCPGLD